MKNRYSGYSNLTLKNFNFFSKGPEFGAQAIMAALGIFVNNDSSDHYRWGLACKTFLSILTIGLES